MWNSWEQILIIKKLYSIIGFQMRPILCKRRFLEIDDLRRLDETYEYDVF